MEKGFQPNRMGGLIWYTDGSKPKTVLELGCIAMDEGGNLASALGGIQWYSGHKCMPLRHAQLRIWMETIKIGHPYPVR
jgi:hypothetical protein